MNQLSSLASNRSQVELSEPNQQFGFDKLNIEIAKIDEAASIEEVLERVSTIVLSNSECLGLWYSDSDGENPPCPVIDPDDDTLGQLELDTIERICHTVSQKQQLAFCPLDSHSSAQFVAAPVCFHHEVLGILTGCFATQNEAPVRHHWLMTLATQSLTNWWQNKQRIQSESKSTGLCDAITLIQQLDSTTNIGAAGRVIVDHLRRILSVEQVAFCYFPNTLDSGELVAVSNLEQIDSTTPLSESILNACSSAAKSGTPLRYFLEDTASSEELESYCRLSRTAEAVVIPLKDQTNEVFAGILLAGKPNQLNGNSRFEYAETICGMFAGHLSVVLRANQGIFTQLKSKMKHAIRENWIRKVALACGATFLAMLIPLPYNVGCDCQLEPVVRRFVASPYDGILEQAFVENGDLVVADQLLARMDGRSLRIEAAGLQADYDAAKKRRDSALASGDIAKSQIARSEMKRQQAEIELINRRLENLEVKSPIAGIVVSGDLEKAQGAPLETGQTLFEVGPLEEMVAEVLVSESEIRFIEPGQSVKIKLNAYPFQTFRGTIQHIHTRSEIISDSNVFVAEVIMDNADQRLKPGMAGSARINTGLSPLGWNLFHHAWEKARHWAIW